MSSFKKHDTTLLIALAIPLVMILFIAASIFIPGIFSHPTYNFIYGIYDNSSLEPAYRIINGKLVDNFSHMNPLSQSPSPQFSCIGSGCNNNQNTQTQYAYTQLYQYDVTTKQSTTLTSSQTQQFKLSSNAQSPDGYTVKPGSQDDGSFFFGGGVDSSSDEYIVGHNVSNKIDYATDASIPNENFYFIGWIIH